MSAISLRLPDSLHKQVREIARREGISINQFASTAIAEKLAALMTEEYLAERAGRGRRDAYLRALDEAPDIDPQDDDALPEEE